MTMCHVYVNKVGIIDMTSDAVCQLIRDRRAEYRTEIDGALTLGEFTLEDVILITPKAHLRYSHRKDGSLMAII